jgi:uncharacterized membrane protein YdjX (TVP38/TMEM64 family)
LRAVMSRKRTWIFVMLAIAVALTLSRLAQDGFFSYQRLLEHERSVRQFIEHRPLASFCIGFAVYTIVSCLPGLTGKSILFGWLFGLWAGLVIVSLSLTIAATFGLIVSRHLFQEFVRRKFAFVVRRIDQSLERQGPVYLVILRLLHVPFTPLNYALGATKVSIKTFAWTTLVGMLPGNFAFVLAGSHLPTLQSVFESGVWSLVDLRVLTALSAAVLIPVIARQAALQFRQRKSQQPESQQSSSVKTQRDMRQNRGENDASSSPGNVQSIKKVARQ